MSLDTINKNTYGFGVGNSTVFKIIVLLLVGPGPLQGSWPTYYQMRNDTENENTYGIGVIIPTFFCDVWSFPTSLGDDPRAISNVPLTFISCL